jgi:hypothetical protein
MVTNTSTERAAYETARALAALEPCAANMRAAIAAWNALEAVTPRRKTSGFASRAGRRQYAERQADSKRR